MYPSLKEDKGHRDIEVNCEYITVETKAAHQQNWEILSFLRIGSERIEWYTKVNLIWNNMIRW